MTDLELKDMEEAVQDAIEYGKETRLFPRDYAMIEYFISAVDELKRHREAVEEYQGKLDFIARAELEGTSVVDQLSACKVVAKEALKKGEDILGDQKSDSFKELEKKHPLGIPDSDGGL